MKSRSGSTPGGIGGALTQISVLCTAALTAASALIAGCDVLSPKPAPVQSAPAAKAPAPRYNLTGYPVAFKDGYADACAKRRSEPRFKNDGDYRMGWQDGSSVCRPR